MFSEFPVSQQDVIDAGESALVAMYNGGDTCTLDNIRFQNFHQKVFSSTKSCDPKVLPPTSAAAKYHSMRVYCQVLQWNNIQVDPKEWGWTVIDWKLFPIQTDHSAVPKELLEMIWCKCKAGCVFKNVPVENMGLLCSAACNECKGVGLREWPAT